MEEIIDDPKDQIDIVWVLKYIFAKRMIVVKSVCLMVLLLVIIYFFKPYKYTATASIIHVSSNSNAAMGGLNSLASIAGLGGDKSKGGEIITPDMYPKVVESTPFLREIIGVKVPWNEIDTLMSFYEYAEYDSLPSFGDYLMMYTIGLPNTISSLFKEKSSSAGKENVDLPYEVYNKYERKAMSSVLKAITVKEDAASGTIEVSVVAENPRQAALLAINVVDLLQKQVIEHRTRRATYLVDCIQTRYDDASMECENVRQKFYDYKDTHRNVVSERAGMEFQRLSDQYDLCNSLLKSISTQLQQAKLALMENTPVFSVVQPVVLPTSTSNRPMVFYIAAGIALGLFLSICWFLMQIAWWQVFDEEKVNMLAEAYK